MPPVLVELMAYPGTYSYLFDPHNDKYIADLRKVFGQDVQYTRTFWFVDQHPRTLLHNPYFSAADIIVVGHNRSALQMVQLLDPEIRGNREVVFVSSDDSGLGFDRIEDIRALDIRYLITPIFSPEQLHFKTRVRG